MQAIGELLTSLSTVAPSKPTVVAYQFQGWTAALQAFGRVLRENATTFNPFRDQSLQIHGGCLAMTPSAAVMGTYNRFPIALLRGKGCWVWDDQSRRHLDAVAGIATCTLGHSNRAIRKA